MNDACDVICARFGVCWADPAKLPQRKLKNQHRVLRDARKWVCGRDREYSQVRCPGQENQTRGHHQRGEPVAVLLVARWMHLRGVQDDVLSPCVEWRGLTNSRNAWRSLACVPLPTMLACLLLACCCQVEDSHALLHRYKKEIEELKKQLSMYAPS